MDITEFELDSSGTLTVADFWEPKTRADFYEFISDSWSESPAHLANAMEECEPLAWAVHSIYSELRDEIQEDTEEPDDGANDWLLTLTSNEFEARVVPQIEKWFDSPPDWRYEDDHLPQNGTAQGAALEFFQSMDGATLDILGVEIVEGEHPGSTYYAAELTGDIDAANKAAADAGIPVRFKKWREHP